MIRQQPKYSLFVLDKPSPPQGPANVEWRTDDSMELRWHVPQSDGGTPITDYIVERREVGKKSWKQVGTSSLCVIEIKGEKMYLLRQMQEYRRLI